MIHESESLPQLDLAAPPVNPVSVPPRKTRSDKGVPKKKALTPPGPLTAEQSERLEALFDEFEEAKGALVEAIHSVREARERIVAFVESLCAR